MRSLRLAAALLLSATLAALPAHADRFAVRAAHFVDVRAGAVRGPVWVVVNGDTVESVEAAAPAGLVVTDLGNATLLPGLIDAHTHLSSRVGIGPMANMKSPAARNAIVGVNNVRATLEAGMDLQGVLGIDAGVRNGFDGIKVHYEIDADATPEQIAALVAQSQKRSAVFDILVNPTDVSVTASKA